jgi:hypothetical protein
VYNTLDIFFGYRTACPKCIEILDIMARPPKKSQDTITKEPQVIIAKEIKGQSAQIPDVPTTKRLRLFQNQAALTKIKEMWDTTPRPSIHEIARKIEYPKATVAENIKKMKEKGKLVA